MTTPTQLVLSKLPNAKASGKNWSSPCPAHDDNSPSLSIGTADNHKVLLNCHAGCTFVEILTAINLTKAQVHPDNFPATATPAAKPSNPSSNNTTGKTSIKTSAKTSVKPPAAPTPFPSMKMALQALERKRGPHDDLSTYIDVNNSVERVVVRWNNPRNKPANKKDIRPIFYTPQGWFLVGDEPPAGGWSIFNLPQLLNQPNDVVFITEGEKACKAAMSLGHLATTSPNGSKSADKANWSYLANHKIIHIFPDADSAGLLYANNVASILHRQNPAAIIRIISIPAVMRIEGGDLADLFQLRGGDLKAVRCELDTLINQTKPITPTDLSDITETLDKTITPDVPDNTADDADIPASARPAKFKPFPVDVLPTVVAVFINAAANAIGCDPSYIALPLLVQYASAIGNSRRIQLKQNWTEPAIIWAAIVGDSGDGKSPALETATRPAKKWQTPRMKEHKQAMREYKRELQAFEAKTKTRQPKTNSGDSPDEPEKPTCLRSWMDDTTIESVAQLLNENPRGLMLIQDELASWLNFDRYSKGSGSGAGKWLEMHGGRSLIIDRKTSGTLYVPSASVSIIGGIQPGILQRYIGQEHRENGLLARLLMTNPPRHPKAWNEADVDHAIAAAMVDIFEKLRSLQPAIDAQGDPEPATLKLSPQAKKAWVKFYNDHNHQQASMAGELSAAWSKLEGYTARFALVVQLMRWATSEADEHEIDETSINAGVTLTRWFSYETQRVYAILTRDEAELQHQQKVELIERQGGSVSQRDWQRINAFTKSSDAKADLEDLITQGLGKWSDPAPNPKGGRPRKVFSLHAQPDDVIDDTPDTSTPTTNDDQNDWGEI